MWATARDAARKLARKASDSVQRKLAIRREVWTDKKLLLHVKQSKKLFLHAVKFGDSKDDTRIDILEAPCKCPVGQCSCPRVASYYPAEKKWYLDGYSPISVRDLGRKLRELD